MAVATTEQSTSGEVHYTAAGWRDLRALMALERLWFGRQGWSWLDLLTALALPGAVREKAELGGQLIGFVIGDRRGRGELGWVASICVHPHYRRRGIGRRLLEDCERMIGTRRMRLTLRVSNAGAMELYRTMGYRKVDVWRGYYQDGEDGLVMEKDLSRNRS